MMNVFEDKEIYARVRNFSHHLAPLKKVQLNLLDGFHQRPLKTVKLEKRPRPQKSGRKNSETKTA